MSKEAQRKENPLRLASHRTPVRCTFSIRAYAFCLIVLAAQKMQALKTMAVTLEAMLV